MSAAAATARSHSPSGAAEFRATTWVPWAVLASDALALEAAFGLGLAVRRLLAPWFVANIGIDQYLGVALGILLLPAINYAIGLYPGYLIGPVERLRRRTLATFAVFAGLVAWDSLVDRGVLSRGVLLATCVFALFLPPLAETAVRAMLLRRRRWGIPVAILGGGPSGAAIARTLAAAPDLGMIPVDSHAEAAIICLADLDSREAARLLREADYRRLLVIPDIPGIASLWVSARDVGGHLGLEIKKNLLIRRNHVLKRLMDRLIAVPLLVLSLPVLLVAAIRIRPAFFRQSREGYRGRQLSVWKLRTMELHGERLLEDHFARHPDERDRWQRYFKLKHDPRVLPGIGRWLRRTSLDELPQLWSVIKGEMSLVGPRPLPDYHLAKFPAEFRALRTQVLPGLTGLWQVSGRSDNDVARQQSLDTYYIRNWSPWLDLYILARTVAAVIRGRGAY